MSSYQADWLFDEAGEWQENSGSEEGEDDDGNDDGSENDMDGDEQDTKDVHRNTNAGQNDGMKADDMDDDMSMDGGSIIEGSIANPSQKKSKSVSKTEKKSIIQLEEEDREFPDELDTPHDMNARDRFARFRALQSFRTSPWHPKENLPIDYNRIYQFENFNGTQKR